MRTGKNQTRVILQGSMLFLFFFFFSASVFAQVTISQSDFILHGYSGELKSITPVITNENAIPSDVYLQTVANTSCLLDSGLTTYNFTLSAKENRTITVFIQIPEVVVAGKYFCRVDLNWTEPDPAKYVSSGSGGGFSSSGGGYVIRAGVNQPSGAFVETGAGTNIRTLLQFCKEHPENRLCAREETPTWENRVCDPGEVCETDATAEGSAREEMKKGSRIIAILFGGVLLVLGGVVLFRYFRSKEEI